MQREKPPEWREKQKGSRGIRRGQRYRLVFQFPIREQKGIEKDIQLGRQEGRSEGEREATLKIARTMLQNSIDRNTVMKMTGLTEDDLAQIRH